MNIASVVLIGLAVFLFSGGEMTVPRMSSEHRLALAEMGAAGSANVVRHRALATASNSGNAFDHYARATDLIDELRPEHTLGSDWPTKVPVLDRSIDAIRAATRAIEHGASRATGRLLDGHQLSGFDYGYLVKVAQYQAYQDYFHGFPRRAAKTLIALEQMHHDVARVVIDAHSLVMTSPAPSLELLSHFVDQGRLDSSALRSLEGDLATLLADKPGPRELILAYLAALAKSVSQFDDDFDSTRGPIAADEWARRLIDLHKNVDVSAGLLNDSPLVAKAYVHAACRQAGMLQDNSCYLPQEIVGRYFEEVATIRALLATIRAAIEFKT